MIEEIKMEGAKAYIVHGTDYAIKIALYKKPNLIFRLFIWLAGWKVEEE